jgi:hypothetical protein
MENISRTINYVKNAKHISHPISGAVVKNINATALHSDVIGCIISAIDDSSKIVAIFQLNKPNTLYTAYVVIYEAQPIATSNFNPLILANISSSTRIESVQRFIFHPTDSKHRLPPNDITIKVTHYSLGNSATTYTHFSSRQVQAKNKNTKITTPLSSVSSITTSSKTYSQSLTLTPATNSNNTNQPSIVEESLDDRISKSVINALSTILPSMFQSCMQQYPPQRSISYHGGVPMANNMQLTQYPHHYYQPYAQLNSPRMHTQMQPQSPLNPHLSQLPFDNMHQPPTQSLSYPSSGLPK